VGIAAYSNRNIHRSEKELRGGSSGQSSMKNNVMIFPKTLGKFLRAVIACIFLAVILIINLLPFIDSQDALMDFGSFYASGQKIRNGENPYDPNSEYIFEINFSRIGAGGKMVNLNPPISVAIFQLLSHFEPHHTLLVWQIVSAIFYMGLVLLLGFFYKQNLTPVKFIWAFMLAGFWHTVVLGQIYIFLLGFAVSGWIFLQRKQYILAGVMIGVLIAFKPNFIIWSLFLLVAGYHVTFIASMLSSLIIGLIPLVMYGTKIYSQWLEASALRRETLIMPGNNSLLGLTARFQSVEAGIVLSAILILAILILLKKKVPSEPEQPELVSALGILTSLLASPISWTGYTILILPVFFSLRKWSPLVLLSAANLCIPFAIVLQLHQTSFANFVIFGWLYGWGIALVLGAVIKNSVMTKSVQAN
jgi:lysylphosphatidylglycerol synthetase-like protein (DUF2156 family)